MLRHSRRVGHPPRRAGRAKEQRQHGNNDVFIQEKELRCPGRHLNLQQIGLLAFEQDGGEFKLSQVYLDTLPGTRPINVSEIAEDVTLDEALTMFSAQFPDSICYVPVTENAFAVTKSNAASIKLVLEDIKNISDIRDTNDDGDAVYEEYVVRDIYHHVFNITDKTKGAETSEERLHHIDLCEVQPVVYNGQKQGPKVVFNGEVLKEGVDYIWKDWGDSGSCKDPGEYDVALFGKGRFAGYTQVHYAIEPGPEPAARSQGGTTLLRRCGSKQRLPKRQRATRRIRRRTTRANLIRAPMPMAPIDPATGSSPQVHLAKRASRHRPPRPVPETSAKRSLSHSRLQRLRSLPQPRCVALDHPNAPELGKAHEFARLCAHALCFVLGARPFLQPQ